ncbi:hypothetical protein, partial [Trujillonella humicola]|uniref:hypothetical protein n=1 Tax=Trujillonella humicola TaxID=3383699 RepID=UPI00390666E1
MHPGTPTRPGRAASRSGDRAGGQVHLDQHGLADVAVPTGDLARAAAAEARRLGMPGPGAWAEALAARAGRAVREADPLTAREREIATLVARA